MPIDNDKCPICRRLFRSHDCPHTTSQAEQAQQKNALVALIRRIVREELAKSR